MNRDCRQRNRGPHPITQPRLIYRHSTPMRLSLTRELRMSRAFNRLLEHANQLGDIVARLTSKSGPVWFRYQEVMRHVAELDQELFGFADSKCGRDWVPIPYD